MVNILRGNRWFDDVIGMGSFFLSVMIEKMGKECYDIHRNQCILYNGEYANGKL